MHVRSWITTECRHGLCLACAGKWFDKESTCPFCRQLQGSDFIQKLVLSYRLNEGLDVVTKWECKLCSTLNDGSKQVCACSGRR